MSNSNKASYAARSVLAWMEGIDSGTLALPSFQRSLVWDNAKTASYLEALFANRPTGLFLTFEAEKQADGKLQFACRALKSSGEPDIDKVEELILDGQQRLTTLWRALNWKTLEDTGKEAGHRFYAKVETFDGNNIEVSDVEFYSSRTGKGKALLNPEKAFEEKLIPVDILLNKEAEGKELSAIPDWCVNACKNGNTKSRLLEKSICSLREQLLLGRQLYYCALDAKVSPNTALNIFIETNKSSAVIKWFDIVVAIAEEKHEENLRERISDFYRENPIITYYFSRDQEKMIPQVGEWILKVACLKTGKPPKEKHYEDALKHLFRGNHTQEQQRFRELAGNLKSALEIAARHGASNHRTLPSWPPIHVIAALQDDIQSVKSAKRKGVATTLITAYLWRAFFTERYIAQVDDKLFEDFISLKKCLKKINDTGTLSKSDLPNIFQDQESPLPNVGDLVESSTRIGIKSRLGRAIAALSLSESPIDWAIREPLDPEKVRGLEDNRKLDSHHIFPGKFLQGSVAKQRIDHGLNKVFLSKETNQSFSKKDPAEYLRHLRDTAPKLSEDKLRKYVESHLVPYVSLIKPSRKAKKDRYEEFLRQREALIIAKIKQLTEIP